MQQYYLHRQFIKNGIRRNAKSIKIKSDDFVCISNDNLIEVYEYTSNGIRIANKYDMGCYIARLEVLPSLQPGIDDYLFIVDIKGRYGIWSISGGFLNVENKIEGQKQSLYKGQKGNDSVQFSGQIHHFDVYDTKGSVFFTLAHKLIVIDYTINRFGLKIDRKSKITIPYVQYRYIDWIRTGKNKKCLGIITQSEQKTTFYIHNLQASFKLDSRSATFEISRMNLLQIISSNDHLVLLTDDQISVFQVGKNYLEISRFNVRGGSGRLISLGQHGFCYIGEEMVIFKGEKMRSYGALIHQQKNILEGKQVLEACLVKQTVENGLMICVTTITNETFFIILHQQTWKLYFHLIALTSIYSIESTPNPNAIIAVMDQSSETYQVAIIERQSSLKLRQEQICSKYIQKLVSIEKGEFIIACSSQGNILLKAGNEDQTYVASMQLPSEQILTLKGNIMITQNAIYAIGIQQNFCEELTRQKIILVESNQDRIVFLNEQYLVKSIDLQTNDTSLLRNGAIQEYAWSLLRNSDLIVARTDRTNVLFVYSGQNVREIALDNDWIINSIKSYAFESDLLVEEFILIGYINGQVHIYSQAGQLKFKIDDYCCQPPSFFSVNSSTIGLFTASKQCLIEFKQNTFLVNPIQLSQSGNSILSVAYLQHYNHLIFVESGIQENNLVRLVSLDDFLSKFDHHQQKKYDSYNVKTICDGIMDIPTVCLLDNKILIAVNDTLEIYSLSTKRLLKTIKHYLKQVIGIFSLSCGIVMYGVDSIERNLIYVFDSKDFQQICNINFILKDNKYIKALQGIPNTNNFLCRGQTFTTMCQIHCPKQIIQLYQLRTDLYGYSLKIDNHLKMAVETDSKRLLFVFTYDKGLLPIARYLAPCQINDTIIFGGCVIIAGKDGHIRILELNTEEKNQPLKMGMTEVGSIFVGDEVTSISRRNDSSAFYGTVSGKIGVVHIISQGEWNALKCCQNQVNPQQQSKNFSYIPWRHRNPQQDKLIDDYFLKKYSRQTAGKQLNEIQQSQYINFAKVFESFSL